MKMLKQELVRAVVACSQLLGLLLLLTATSFCSCSTPLPPPSSPRAGKLQEAVRLHGISPPRLQPLHSARKMQEITMRKMGAAGHYNRNIRKGGGNEEITVPARRVKASSNNHRDGAAAIVPEQPAQKQNAAAAAAAAGKGGYVRYHHDGRREVDIAARYNDSINMEEEITMKASRAATRQQLYDDDDDDDDEGGIKKMMIQIKYRTSTDTRKAPFMKKQLMERQRETIWAEMRGPKYRVDNTRAFHADYAEAHPHPPRNN